VQTSQSVLIVGSTVVTCVAIWLALFWRSRKAAPPFSALCKIVFVAGLSVRLAYVFFTPVFYAPDEEPHFKYIQHLAEKKYFPIQISKLGDPTNDWEYNQPPLYYLLATPVFAVANGVFRDQNATVITLRLFSVLLWLANVWFVMKVVERMQIESRFVRNFIVSMVCLLPTYTVISSAINNDNLLAALGSGMICGAATRERNTRTYALLGVLLGLGLLTKQSAVIFAPMIATLVVVEIVRKRIAWGKAAQQLAVTFGIAGLLYLPWATHNWQVYQTFMPENLVVTQIPWPSAIHGIASATHNLVKTFWSVAGLSNDVGYPFPLIGILLLIAPVIAFAFDSKPTENLSTPTSQEQKPLLISMAVALGIAVCLVLRFGYQFGMGQGRHLFPLLLPIAWFLAVWLRRLPFKQLEIHAAGFWITYAAGFAAFALCRFPR
jgi:4-amino-4-deoxy-L-arabinose transferase-like glycosyltransferase